MKTLVISPKDRYAAKRLLVEAARLKLPIDVLSVGDLAKKDFEVDIAQYSALYIRNPYFNGEPDYLLEVINLAKRFKKAGKRVVDSTIGDGNIARGKWVDYQMLKKAGLLIPTTQMLEPKNETKSLPFIIKWVFGLKAKHVYLVNSQKDLDEIIKRYAPGQLMLQEFIEAEYEYKVITVGYKSLPVVLRFAINPKTKRPDFRTAETLANDKETKKIVQLAEKASKVLKRELAKVDILEKAAKYYILEVNRFPGLKSFESLTKFNVAAEFIKYLNRSQKQT